MGTHYKGRADVVRALDTFVKLSRASTSVHARLHEHLRTLGLKESQLGVLEMLYHLGPLRQHEIGRKLLLSRANVTLLVDQLSEQRLVRREQDPEDRRAILVHLTPEGRRRIAKAFPAHARKVADVFSALTATEQRELGKLCRKLGLANQAD